MLCLATLPLPPLERPPALRIEDRQGRPLRAFLSPDGSYWRFPVKREDLSPQLVEAVLTFEDQRFRWHPGVDPLALLRATYQNVSIGRVVSGGSTITMQVARMIDPRPRTVGAKLLEIFRALQLELRYSKDEILTHYLNLAPYGGNLEGIGAAAELYFDKPVSLLTLDESAALAALPNAPARLSASKERLLARRNEVLARMVANGAITEDEGLRAQLSALHFEKRRAPARAPHLAELLRRAHLGAARVKSAIDPELQRFTEELLANHSRQLAKRGITAAAAVVIENDTRKIRALVGSPDFFDPRSSGQVDGTRALRSPGSTLKPFVYARAFDRGIAGVNSALEDVPLSFKDWAPENFDGGYRGLISAEDALRASLNIPAVELSRALEPEGLIGLLQRAGFEAFRRETSRFGLSAVLGGCEVTLLELTNLYATLASGGLHREPSFLEDEHRGGQAGVRLFSSGAAYLVTEILSDVRRPELPDVWKDAASIPRVAWKTGTSYGRRDAWTVGYDPRFTVGVWVGNFDGHGVPELVGVHAAAPLFFSIFEALPRSPSWFAPPPQLAEREVCSLSGKPPGPHCAHLERELALPSAPAERCDLHQGIEVDDRTGKRLCSKCRGAKNRHLEVHVVWPPRVAAQLAKLGVSGPSVPEHDPECARGLAGKGPMIASPLDGDQLLLRDGVPLSLQKIALAAAVEGGASTLFWFVDGALVGEAPAGRTVEWTPAAGRHRISAVDEEGRSSTIEILIRHSGMLALP